MKRRVALYIALFAAAALLYFFENGTATRAMLVSAVVLPLIPPARKALFSPDAPDAPDARDVPIIAAVSTESEEISGARLYQAGDPIRLIHWKLTAKKDGVMVREAERDTAIEPSPAQAQTEGSGARRKSAAPICLLAAAAFLALTLALPQARRGAMALMNRLFDLSEAVNAYSYVRFDVAADQATAAAVALLIGAGLSLAAAAALSRSRFPAVALAAAVFLGQAYFGLALPGAVNLALFALTVLALAGRPRTPGKNAWILGTVACAALAVALIMPGVDAGTEAASETVRDRLSQAASRVSASYGEAAGGGMEVRRAHTRTLIPGDETGGPGKAYRLVTVDVQRVSLPHVVDYIRIILMLALTVAVVVAPFLPFVYLNARKKAALRRRELFASPDAGEAVIALFRHVMAWHDAAGGGLSAMPEDYISLYDACKGDYEEAFYSAHPIGEEQRRRAETLLERTEELIKPRCGLKERLILKYGACLWL